MIHIDPVRSRADRRAFRRLPFRLYAQDPHWVPPLNRDIAAFLDTRRHPFYEHSTIDFFLARREGEVVGRIAAIDNRPHNEKWKERTAFFGFFESERDPEVAALLFRHVEEWSKTRGFMALRGPCSPSTNYECGLLVGGEPGPPKMMMAHNPLWYGEMIEGQGFGKVMDLLAFWVHNDAADTPRWRRVAQKLARRSGVTFRHLDRSRFSEEVELMTEIYHDAWSENWGFVPMGRREVLALAKELKPVILPYLGSFAVRDGREIGFSLGIPDINRVLLSLKGRLFPLGFLKILRSLRRLDSMRLLLMGVRKEYQNLGIDACLLDAIVQGSVNNGVFGAEASWVLETNAPLVNAMARSGGRHYRTYRLYEKSVEKPAPRV